MLKKQKVTKEILLILAGTHGLAIPGAVPGRQAGLKAGPLQAALTSGLGLGQAPVAEWCQNIRAKLKQAAPGS